MPGGLIKLEKLGSWPLPYKAIEQIHEYFCKSVIKLKPYTTNEIMYGELGRVPWLFKDKLEL